MLTTFLNLYIVSMLKMPIATDFENLPEETQTVKMAGINISNILEMQNLPIKNPTHISPLIDAESSIVTDLKTGTTLYEKNSHKKLQIASITKLMTALIILEETDLNEIALVSANAANTGGSAMMLQTNEKIAVENLLYGAIIHSANDAAVALAEHNAETTEKFVEKMNQKAKEIGLSNTHFSNPIGLDDPMNYSSAYDLAKLAKYVYEYDFIKHAAILKELEVKSVSGKYVHKLESTNELLGSYLKVKGLKTGKTDAAGLCLISVAENDTGNDIITVVLNSPARFTETKILIDWTFRAYNW